MFVQFRLFKQSQLDDVIEITKRNLTERYNDFVFLDIQKSWPSAFILGMSDQTVAGFICGGISGEKEARILMLAVDKPFRRNGIGTGLITLFEQEAQKVKINRIKLEVRTDNLEAIAFYKNHGYSIASLLPSYYNDGSDAYSMEKILTQS
ncbi:MAG: GNAT family N-acetyltransferase [Candidatus Thermoplasmatota archaeon]|jgi:ribosomal-protein-alanine N-acetyltransferase|nr:GNAT family N-acetyltransferase [Candidatus Thermoplasmatota archaeon]MCL5789633.1 GNAT family N-acetyltransferase [Candidatus Thermoplasmatota archaeon]